MSTFVITPNSMDATMLDSNIAAFTVKFVSSDLTETDIQYYEVHNVTGENDVSISNALQVTGDIWESTFTMPDYLTYSE